MTTTGVVPGFPEPGEELGPFRLGRRLGLGGMGVVYEALDTQLQRQVALKIIAPHLAHDDGFRARFTREARAQASLDSTHVVQVYSFGEAGGRLYIASQLIPDGDLGQMLAGHGLPPVRVALHLLAQVAEALVDAHAAGLVHRDIKPANVLLRHRDQALNAYLADFGIARQVGATAEPPVAGAITHAGAQVGTPAYMAPELHTGGEAGPLCDIYSLGCLLWATLTGAAPYAGGTDYQVVSGHVSGRVPQVGATGPLAVEVNRVLALALAKEPGDRYPSAQALRDDLHRVLRLPDDDLPLRAVSTGAAEVFPDPPPGPAPAGATRRWVPIGVASAVLAIAAVVLVLLLVDRGGGAGRDAQVVEVLSGAFADQAGVDEAAGVCVAERVVAEVGVEALIEAGVIDEELEVLDEDLTDPDLISVLFSASFACAAGADTGADRCRCRQLTSQPTIATFCTSASRAASRWVATALEMLSSAAVSRVMPSRSRCS